MGEIVVAVDLYWNFGSGIYGLKIQIIRTAV
jgi:hypothetical protein